MEGKNSTKFLSEYQQILSSKTWWQSFHDHYVLLVPNTSKMNQDYILARVKDLFSFIFHTQQPDMETNSMTASPENI